MIELPEALNLANQLNSTIVGKTVRRALPPTKLHKFCFWNGSPTEYETQMKGAKVVSAKGFGIFVEMIFDNGKKLCINDGTNVRFISSADAPKDYQLLICFDDGSMLAFTVAMYGAIMLHDDGNDNEYYLKSKSYISPFLPEFEPLYFNILDRCKVTMSAKAFLATEQRFPGIGNGVLQDILFNAGIHPKQKVGILDQDHRIKLLSSVVSTLQKMVEQGGRNTEKDLFGEYGGYQTKMSKKSFAFGCTVCGGIIMKESYMGGSVYYCPNCQKLI